jgi:acetylornithine deacetylase
VTHEPLSLAGLAELTAALVRIPSVNPSIAPEERGDERAIARFACDWLEAHGARAWMEDAAPGRPNAVAEVVGGDGPTLVLCAHLDTVGTQGMTIPPFEPTLAGDRLYGRGSYDMKGGAACIMAVAASLAGKPFGGRVLLALVADEEHASIGTTAFVRRHTADACIVTEPSALELVLAHKGFVWAEVTTRGRAAHGSRWDLGSSAIAGMGHVIAALDAFDRDVLRARTHAMVGPASMHPALVSGGAGISTYAPECRLRIERRTLPGEAPERIVAELRDVVARVAPDATVELLLDRPPLECDAHSPLARSVREAATRQLGRAPKEVGVAFWMDAALFEAAGIPTVDFGGDGAGAHEAVEWVSVRSLEACARVLEQAVRDFMADAAKR